MIRLRLRAPALVVAAMLTLLGFTGSPASAAVSIPTATWTYGRSAEGRAITVTRRGFAPEGVVDVLVVGVIHGNETAGVAVTRRLRSAAVPAGVRLWIVESSNPDGRRSGTRQNARGVDLNRNFPFRWRGGGAPFDTYYPGPSAASEPETRVVQRLVGAVRPDVTIWYHQHLDMVLRPAGSARIAVARCYAYASGMRLRDYPGGTLYGTATSWQTSVQPAGAPFVVELPAGRLGAAAVERHARAVLRTGAFVRDRANAVSSS